MRCNDLFGPFQCEYEMGHEGNHKFDGREVGEAGSRPSAPHPEYGPCDAIANGQCAECIRRGLIDPAPSGESLEEHPYHEACPKCLHTKKLLQKRLRRFEDSMEGLRQAMGISAVHYDTPEKIANAVKTRLLHWLGQSQSSPVDLKDAAEKWLDAHGAEFWTQHYDPKYGEFNIPAALAAFAEHLREGK